MKSRNKKVLFISIILLFIIVFHLLTFLIDSYKISKNKRPIFALPSVYIKDGGTTIYFGFGYQVIYWHFLTSIEENNKKIYGYKTGYEIHHLFKLKYIPFFTNNFTPDKKTNLKFITK